MANLWGILPPTVFLALVVGQLATGRPPLAVLLRSAVGWAAGVWVLSNGLSLTEALRPGPLRVVWSALVLIAVAWAVRRVRIAGGAGWARWPRPAGTGEWLAAGVGAALVTLALVAALASPPVTVDVLNYHLPRQLMWLQQGSLAHYVTRNDRELMMPPLAEVIGLQFLGLTGDDRWANLSQWCAYALLPLAAVATVRALGASRAAAMLAAWLVLCLPMAYHEAANGKNDLQGALWLTLLAWQVAEARRAAAPPDRRAGLLAGVTLALALLTKSTALLFAPPLLVAGALAWGRPRWRAAVRPVAVAALAAALLTLPFLARNLAWYGRPLGEHRAEDGGDQTVDAVTPALVLSNAVRNATVHLAGPWPEWNALLRRGTEALHGWLGVSVDDPRSTLWVLKYAVSYRPREEASAGAPWHFLAIAAALPLAFRRRGPAAARWLAAAVAVMALLFCAVLKWQAWGARLELPVFVTGSLLVAVVADGWSAHGRRCGLCLIGLLGLAAWWPSRETSVRPLWTAPTLFDLSRDANRYRYYPASQERDAGLVGLVQASGAREVAVISLHDITYPLLRALQQGVRGVHFYGAPAAGAERPPEAILVLNLTGPLALYYDWPGGGRYRLVGRALDVEAYLPLDRVRALGWERQLPAFAGWTRHEDLPMRTAGLPVPGQTGSVLVMSTPAAAVYFSAEGGRVRLAGTVRKTTATPEWLDLTINGAPAGRLGFVAKPGLHTFETWLPARAGQNRLEFHREAAPGTEMVFSRLVIDDGPLP